MRYSGFIINICLLILFLSSCRTTRHTPQRTSYGQLSLKSIIDERTQNTPEYTTLEGKITVSITNKGKNMSSRGNLRIIKDSVIQLSIQPYGIMEAFRLVVTPEKITCIDRLNSAYFQEPISALSPELRSFFNYPAFQALLTNQLFTNSGEDIKLSGRSDFEVQTSTEESMTIQEKKQPHSYINRFTFDSTLNLTETSVLLKNKKGGILCSYEKFNMPYGSFYFPELINMYIDSGKEPAVINIKFNNLIFNKPVNISDAVSNKYTRLAPDDIIKVINNL